MKKDITMRKATFVKGAFIATFGIVFTKILGILYVIPFHSLIGEKGGSLYGYAYTVYTFFMSLATAGIPLAISKVVSEYQTLGYYNTKKRVFQIGKKMALLLGSLSFFLIVLLAPFLAKAILGDVQGGNTVDDVTFVIRVIGSAILIVPLLSIYRGYFEGHRFISPPSISQVLEQFVRVFIIIVGSFLSIKVFHFDLKTTVGISLLGATIGAFVSYLYLVEKKIKNKGKFHEKIRQVNEPIVTNSVILKKIIIYAIPFILIDIFKSIYNYTDMLSLVKGLVHFASFSVMDAETIYSMFSTWANKFNMIVLAISTGVIVSLVPNLAESVVNEDEKSIHNKISQALGILLFLTIPMTFGISFLAKPIWILFYGSNVYGPSVLSFYIFSGFFIGLFTLMITVLQSLKDYKSVFFSLICGALFKIFFNSKLIIAFYKMSFPAYYGAITATIIGYLISIVCCFIILHKKYHYSFENVLKNLVDVLCGSFGMIFILIIVRFLIPISSSIRIVNLFIIIFYSLMGVAFYFIYGYYTHLTSRIFGKNILSIIRKILLKK